MRIQKTDLAEKLNKIKGVVPKDTTMSVLRGVLVKDGYLTASNMEMTVRVKTEDADGECFVIPERAFNLINNLPDGEVDIGVSGRTMTIKADRITNRYQTEDAEQFPLVPSGVAENEATMRASVLMEAIKRVSFAIPQYGENPRMKSMYLKAGGGTLNFVGLDGHVVAWDKVDYDGEFGMIVPKNTVEKLKNLGMAGDVRIGYGKTAAIFASEDIEVYTRLVDGEYFNYETAFRDLPLHTVVSRKNLLDAMTRVKMCTEEKIPVRFELQGSQMNLSIKGKLADYHETVDLQEEMAETLTIGFDVRLALDAFKAFDCDNVGLSFGGAKMPMIVEAEDSDFRALVLPVAIKP